MSAGEKYVAAAYLVVFVAVLAWVAIIASKLARLSREVDELTELARRRLEREGEPEEQSRVEVG
jgi:CcmD family protein